MYTIMPTVDSLRGLHNSVHRSLGADMGSKHANARLTEDIQSLMDSLEEHRVYSLQRGRVTDEHNQTQTVLAMRRGAWVNLGSHPSVPM